MSNLYSHKCDKPCELSMKVKCVKPCEIAIISDENVNVEETLNTSKNNVNSCSNIYGYNNKENSCYLDSVLFALFAFESNFIKSEMLNVSDDILYDKIFSSQLYKDEESINKVFEYVKHIRSILNDVFYRFKKNDFKKEKYCVTLRNDLLKNPSEILKQKPSAFWSTGEQQDSGEFLTCLVNTFFINNRIVETISKKKNINLGYEEDTIEKKLESPIIQINVEEISGNLNEYFKLSERIHLETFDEIILYLESDEEVIILKKIKIMYKIFNLLVAYSNMDEIKFINYINKISKLDPSYKKILDRLKDTPRKFNDVEDVNYEELNSLYNYIISDINKLKGYTSELISLLNKVNLDPKKGYYKAHQEILKRVKYFNYIENKRNYSFISNIEPYLIININRFNEDLRSKNRKKIDIEEIIEFDGIRLTLNSIIIHQGTSIKGGHYLTMFKCNDNWYLYNDIPKSTIQKIGSFDELKKYTYSGDTSYMRDGTLFFYNTLNPKI